MFLTATNVPQSFSDFVFECDSAIVLLKEHSEFCGHETIPVDPQYEEGEEEVKVSTYCSRDLIISEDERFDKINAVASLLMEKEIRGNLVVLADEGKGKNRGFLYPLVRGIFLYVRCALISVHQ